MSDEGGYGRTRDLEKLLHMCMNLEISRNRDNSTNKTIMHLHQVMTCRGGLVRYMNMK